MKDSTTERPVEWEGRPVLELRGIEKSFGPVTAVYRLNIEFEIGRVHALLGENGAGKSTLMNIAAGFLTPDAGRIIVDGRPLSFGSPKDAIAMGIGMVHQHFRLVDKFTVAENLAIGARDVGAVTSARELRDRAALIAERFSLAVEPDRVVGSLSVGERQRVEILRTLSRGARVLILDEPTAVLTPEESERLCQGLRALAAGGVAVVFISHKLNEVISVADSISVMRRGRLHATVARKEASIESLSRMMFDDVAEAGSTRSAMRSGSGADVLVLSDLTMRDERGLPSLRSVSLRVQDHEIVGVVGVAGNGQRALEHAVSGLADPQEGAVTVGRTQVRGVRGAQAAGLAHVPEDRLGSGLVGAQPIWRNAILRAYRREPIRKRGLIRTKLAKRFAHDLSAAVDLSTSDVNVLVQHLSGGNAQKLLVGRELSGDTKALVVVNPTQGLDVKAALAVRRRLVDARNAGLAILLISADLDEAIAISDRILVLYEGRVVGEFPGDGADRDRIGLLMGGGS